MEERNTRGVECLIAEKVYDGCSKKECMQNMPFELDLNSDISEYTFLYVQFGSSMVEHYESEPYFSEIDECKSKMKCVVAIPAYAVLRRKCDRRIIAVPMKPICKNTVQSDNKIRIPISSVFDLDRKFVRQGRFYPVSECFVESNCVRKICSNQISISLGFVIVVNAVSKVNLKIPTFGYCELPDECRQEECSPDFCENFLSEDISDFGEFFPSNGVCKRCDCD